MYSCTRNPRILPEHQCCSFGLHVFVDTAKPVHEFEFIDYHDASMFVMTSMPSVGITSVRSYDESIGWEVGSAWHDCRKMQTDFVAGTYQNLQLLCSHEGSSRGNADAC